MPDYTSTILLLFILGSCFYKKHIRDWWWFWFGVITFAASVVTGELGPGDQSGWTVYSLVSRSLAYGSASTRIAACVYILHRLTLIAAGLGFFMACFKRARLDHSHIKCLKCGYILKGLKEPRCPECGWQI